MTQEHPITPPEELVDQWNEAWIDAKVKHEGLVTFIATQAARWGADQELEACKEWVSWRHSRHESDELLFARRPKPPSLRDKALAALQVFGPSGDLTPDEIDALRHALESLPD
jgi:hypothetical protein